ncbi:MAG: hypothetical protein CHACPFDD_00848 [Phycisphaerae bacterium]|nr:hypothetical protein [Phycisphaerae bacterium]
MQSSLSVIRGSLPGVFINDFDADNAYVGMSSEIVTSGEHAGKVPPADADKMFPRPRAVHSTHASG